MNADLVCAACLQAAFDIGVVPEPLQDLYVGDSIFAVGTDCHFFAVGGIPADRTGNRQSIFLYVSQDDRPVSAHNGMIGQLQSYTAMGGVIFADDDTAGGILVDPVDYARPEYAVDSGKAVAAVKKNGIDKSAGIMSCSRMDDHILWLIDDQNIIVFIEDIQRNVLGKYIRQHPHGKKDRYRLTFDGTGAGLDGFLSHPYTSLFNQLFEIAPGLSGNSGCQDLVDPFSCIPGRDNERKAVSGETASAARSSPSVRESEPVTGSQPPWQLLFDQ